METIIIAKAGVTYGGKSSGTAANIQDAVNMVEGAIGVFDETGTLIAGNAVSISGNSLTFAVKRGSDLKISFPVYKDNFSKSEVAYVAPAAKVMAIGSNTDAGTTYNLNIPSTIVEGQNAILSIIDTAKPTDEQTRIKAYEVPVLTGDTAITVMSRLMTKINADTKRLATMSKIDATNSDGYLLTAVKAGVNFALSCGGILENADVLERTEVIYAGTAGVSKGAVSALTNLVANNTGHGTYAQMVEAELSASTHEGNNNYPGGSNDLYTQPSMVVSGGMYNQAVLSSTRPNDNVLIPRSPLTRRIHVGIPTGDANWAILQNILALFIA